MEIVLFIIVLVGMALSYIVFKITLVWCLAILTLTALLYLGLRYPLGKADYHIGMRETLYTLIMILVIIVIFVALGPQPVPMIGAEFTYGEGLLHGKQQPSEEHWLWEVEFTFTTVTLMMLIFVLFFLVLLGFLLAGEALKAPGIEKPAEGKEEETGIGKQKIGIG